MRPNCMPSFLRKAQKLEDPWYPNWLTSRAACTLPNFSSKEDMPNSVRFLILISHLRLSAPWFGVAPRTKLYIHTYIYKEDIFYF